MQDDEEQDDQDAAGSAERPKPRVVAALEVTPVVGEDEDVAREELHVEVQVKFTVVEVVEDVAQEQPLSSPSGAHPSQGLSSELVAGHGPSRNPHEVVVVLGRFSVPEDMPP